MGKKNKVRLSKKKKLEEKAKKSSTISGPGTVIDDLKDADPGIHSEQMAAIISLPSRVDEHVKSMSLLQKQLQDLQIEQVRLLDGFVDFLLEFQTVKPETDADGKLVVETFTQVKAKIRKVFDHYLPMQLEMLEKEMQSLEQKTMPTSK